MEIDTQLGAGHTVFPSGVEDFSTAVCRHAGSYLQSLEAKLAEIDSDKTQPDQLGALTFQMNRNLGRIFYGAWNDTGVPWVDARFHQCQCLGAELPSPLHSQSLHVTADETEVRVHNGPSVPIRG